jgi:hypothetical protein
MLQMIVRIRCSRERGRMSACRKCDFERASNSLLARISPPHPLPSIFLPSPFLTLMLYISSSFFLSASRPLFTRHSAV